MAWDAEAEELTLRALSVFGDVSPNEDDPIADAYLRAFQRAGFLSGDGLNLATTTPDVLAFYKDELRKLLTEH